MSQNTRETKPFEPCAHSVSILCRFVAVCIDSVAFCVDSVPICVASVPILYRAGVAKYKENKVF